MELTKPRAALQEAGAVTKIVSGQRGMVQGVNHNRKADQFEVREVVVDGNRVSSRNPSDIPAFNVNVIELFSQHAQRERKEHAQHA